MVMVMIVYAKDMKDITPEQDFMGELEIWSWNRACHAKFLDPLNDPSPRAEFMVEFVDYMFGI